MSRILILSSLEMDEPSGLPTILRRLIGAIVASGRIVVLALRKSSCGIPLFDVAVESYTTETTCLQVQWWPDYEFEVDHREEFAYRIERLHAEQPFSHIIALDVRQTGFAATVVGRLIDVPTSVLVTHRNAFQEHFSIPQELDVVAEHARYLISANPAILDQLAAFYDVSSKLILLDARPDDIETSVPKEPVQQAVGGRDGADRPYVITTGTLNSRIHLGDLLQRVAAALASDPCNWLHVGVCDPNTLITLHRHLTTRGIERRFQITGLLARERYAQTVRNALLHIVPRGERNTNLGVYESQAWAIPTDLPTNFPFPCLADRRAIELHLGAYDLHSAADFPRRLLS